MGNEVGREVSVRLPMRAETSFSDDYTLKTIGVLMNNSWQIDDNYCFKINHVMARGKQTCKILKEIRKQIATENDIKLVVEECTYQGDCARNAKPRCAIWSANWRNGNVWAKQQSLRAFP